MVSLFGPARRYNKTEIVTKKASILTYELSGTEKLRLNNTSFSRETMKSKNDIIAVLLPQLSYLTIK